MGPVLQDDTAAITSGTETILLAEDDEMVRMLTGRVLRAQGYTVHLAESGAAALQIAQECAGRINLLVTDVVMPGISGRELSERLAATHPEAKVLYMSGYTDDAVIRNGVLKEGIAFIQKPYTLTGLLREIREVLDGASTSVNA